MRLRRASYGATVGMISVITFAAPSSAYATEERPSVVTADGRVLYEGSVVAQGTDVGDLCRFGETPALGTLVGAMGSITVVADDSCRLVVKAITDTALAPDVASQTANPYVVPRIDRTGPAVSLHSVCGHFDDCSILSDPPEASIHRTSLLPTEGKTTWEASVWSVVRDQAGAQIYQSATWVLYTKDAKKRTVFGLKLRTGYCAGAEKLQYPWIDDPLTHASCSYYRLANGPNTVAFMTEGRFSTGVGIDPLIVRLDGRTMREYFSTTYAGPPRHSCDTGGDVPKYWEHECGSSEFEY